jgi:hypothetical protein
MISDFRGVEIKIGDNIVYPGRSGSCLWMNEGIVIDFYTYEVYWDNTPRTGLKVKRTDFGKNVKIRNVNRVCIINGDKK